MKIIIAFIALFCASVTAFAQTINIIVAGKPGGSAQTRSMLMKEGLELQGYTVNLIQAGTTVKGEQIFKNTSDPVILPVTDSDNAGNTDNQPTRETYGVLEYAIPVMFCSVKYSDFSASEIKIAYSASWPPSIAESLGTLLNKKVIAIPFKNSGEAALGMISGNTDYWVASIGHYGKAPDGACFTLTGDVSYKGMTPIKELVTDYKYENLHQHGSWLIRNIDKPEQLRDALHNSFSTKNYKKWHSKKSLPVPAQRDFEKHLANSYEGAYNWGRPRD